MSPLPCAAHLLLAAPLAGLAASGLLAALRRPRQAHWPILLSCAVVTAASWSLAWKVLNGGRFEGPLFSWIAFGRLSVDFGIRIDGLSASVLAMVSLVGALIHAYAAGYMKEDPGFARFFLYFHFFFFSMIGLLISSNYLQLYMFWESVGVASFLLIGFWWQKPTARAAAWKAFLTNRIGDAGFLLALVLMLGWSGSFRFDDVFSRLAFAPAASIPLVAGLLFWGACAKSAQFPLYVWLPDAMEGPTPVSALMHAATMVTAGVFLMARSEPLLARAPGVAAAMAGVGAFTAVFAALLAATRRDLKRILAYSTVSHLGLMILSLGLGNLLGAVLHLIAHGFFKAALFLCAGNLIHATATAGKTSAGIDDVGGLAGKMPWTAAAFCLSAAALAGVPPLSGFFSKDLILESAMHRGGAIALAGLLVAAGSSFYIGRMLLLAFFGERAEQSGPRSHAHEAGPELLVPVLLLALGSALAGLLGPTGVLARMLGLREAFHLQASASAAGLGMAAAGAAAAWALTMLRPSFDWSWRRAAPGLERWLDSDFGAQSLAAELASAALRAAGWLAAEWEARRWDAFAESLADTCVGLGEGLSGLTRGSLNDYLWWMLAGAAGLGTLVVLWR